MRHLTIIAFGIFLMVVGIVLLFGSGSPRPEVHLEKGEIGSPDAENPTRD
jgi:hypothetical protein